ncbi:selenium binding protein SBP56 [Actinokineospora spheciospongiae]|nr:selenium binding protein SBP56 [Actinokineospora spheciospongiae]
MSSKSQRWRKGLVGLLTGVLAVGAVTYSGENSAAYADVQTTTASLVASDGKSYWVKNHLVGDAANRSAAAEGKRKEWLLVWAGDENIADTLVKDLKNLPGSLAGGLSKITNALPGPDFLAVIDATEGSPTYGHVVNTATVGPLVENEPHHMQYVWNSPSF